MRVSSQPSLKSLDGARFSSFNDMANALRRADREDAARMAKTAAAARAQAAKRKSGKKS